MTDQADARGADPTKNDDPGPYDVIVVGAGAAGLMAAHVAASRGRRTLLVEKNRKPGAKILMSGGSRCNLTHATNRRGIVDAFGQQGRFLHAPLAALGPDELVEFFHAQGVDTKVESTGKVFPASDRALHVLQALLNACRESGVRLALGEAVASITMADSGVSIATTSRQLTCESLVLATGGQSYPGCGTTGDGFRFARQLGHTIVPPRPALVPLCTSERWVRELAGVTLPEVVVTALSANEPARTPREDCRGALLFTHFGLSGPAILDISRRFTAANSPAKRLSVDFLPDWNSDRLQSELQRSAQSEGSRSLITVLAQLIPRSVADSLLASHQVDPQRRIAELPRDERRRVVDAIKATTIPIDGTRGFAKAEVTAGGICREEIDSKTMRSRLHPALFVVGEVLDLDGPIGGYNFQAAFSTGWLAGQHA